MPPAGGDSSTGIPLASYSCGKDRQEMHTSLSARKAGWQKGVAEGALSETETVVQEHLLRRDRKSQSHMAPGSLTTSPAACPGGLAMSQPSFSGKWRYWCWPLGLLSDGTKPPRTEDLSVGCHCCEYIGWAGSPVFLGGPLQILTLCPRLGSAVNSPLFRMSKTIIIIITTITKTTCPDT